MTLRTRVTLAAGVAVFVAVAALSMAVFAVVRTNLRDKIDDSLLEHLHDQRDIPTSEAAAAQVPLVENVYLQIVNRDGQVVTAFDNRTLPVTASVRAVARGDRTEAWFDADIDGTPVRIAVASPEPGVAFEVGRSLGEVDESLRQLSVALAIISIAAVGLAALLGRLVAAAASAPVHRVACAAEAVARTGDLSHHLDVPGGDDLGRLATSFNKMLDALKESLARQRCLVADASHELRTPLATVRTNVEVLARAGELDPGDRDAIISDTVTQLGELTRLVGDLVDLARGEGESEPCTTMDLREVTRSAVEAVGRNYPGINFDLEAVPTQVQGAPSRVTRAVANLIDNAAKWSPACGTVEIAVAEDAVTVRDHGPGVHAEDLPRIFDRFYRSAAARTLPGSGLGLAIVKQVAENHGGSITAEAAPGGGARFVLRLPTLRTKAGVRTKTRAST